MSTIKVWFAHFPTSGPFFAIVIIYVLCAGGWGLNLWSWHAAVWMVGDLQIYMWSCTTKPSLQYAPLSWTPAEDKGVKICCCLLPWCCSLLFKTKSLLWGHHKKWLHNGSISPPSHPDKVEWPWPPCLQKGSCTFKIYPDPGQISKSEQRMKNKGKNEKQKKTKNSTHTQLLFSLCKLPMFM